MNTYMALRDELTVLDSRWAKTKRRPKTTALKKAPTEPVYNHGAMLVSLILSTTHASSTHVAVIAALGGNSHDTLEGDISVDLRLDLPLDHALILVAVDVLAVDADGCMFRDERLECLVEFLYGLRLVESAQTPFEPLRELREDDGSGHGFTMNLGSSELRKL